MADPDPLAKGVAATREGQSLRAAQMHASLQERMFGQTPTPIRIDRFVVQEALGQGAMGVVFAAFDPQLDRKVALKLLRVGGNDDGTIDSGGARARLVREAKALARLAHPNVVTIFEVGEFEGRIFLAMEFVDGVDLRQWLSDNPDTSWRQRLDLLIASGEGLAAAHGAGLVHRDFKPENVLIGHDGRARVADFGLARPTEHPRQDLDTAVSRPDRPRDHGTPASAVTRTGAVLGTPAYMPPEQRRAEAIDARADQFAFCVTVHEALRGHRPGGDDTAAATPWPRALDTALTRGMAADATDRFGTMPELLTALRSAVRPRRSRLAVASLATIVVAGLGAGLMAMNSGEPCPVGAQAWQTHWNPTKQAVLSTALNEAAPARAASVVRELDRYGEQWIAVNDRVCTEVDAAPAGVNELQRQCLEARLAEVDALLEVIADAPTEPAAAVRLLPDPGQCQEVRRLVARYAEVASVEQREHFEAAHRQLARAAALTWAEQPELALPILDKVQAEYGEAFVAVRAAVAFARAKALVAVGEADQARAELVAAFVSADATGDDRLRAEVALALAHHVGFRQVQTQTGGEWAEIAAAIIERLEQPERLRIRLQQTRGSVAYAAGHYEDSVTQHRAALAGLRALPPVDDAAVAQQIASLSGAVQESGASDEAVRLASEALALFESAAVVDARVATAHNTLSVALLRQGKFEASAVAAEDSLALFERTHAANHPDLAMAHSSVAIARASQGSFTEAVPHFERAVAIWTRAFGPDHARVGAAIGNLALAMYALDRHADAVEHAEQALAVQTKILRPGHPDLVFLYLTLGKSLSRLGEHERALRSLAQAQVIVTAERGDKHPQNAVVGLELGQALLAADRAEDALEPLRKTCALFDASGAAIVQRGDCRFHLGRAQWLATEDAATATATLEEAQRLFSSAEGEWATIRRTMARDFIDTKIVGAAR